MADENRFTISSRLFHERAHGKWRLFLALNSIAWFLIIMIVGWFILPDSALPGISARAMATITDPILANTVQLQPILSNVVNWAVDILPLSNVATMNLFGLIAMALCVAIFVPIMQFWTEDFMSKEESAILHARSYSLLVSNLSALLVVGSLTGFFAMTTFLPLTFSVLWALFIIRCITSYAGSGALWRILSLSILWGFGLGESELLLLITPFLFAMLLIIEWRLWDRQTRYIPLWFCGMVIGLFAFVILNAIMVDGWENIAISSCFKIELALFRLQVHSIFSYIPRGSWFFLLLFAPVLSVFASIIGIKAIGNMRSISLIFCLSLLSLALLIPLFMIKFSPISIWASQSDLPVISNFLLAAATAFVFGGWFVQRNLPETRIAERLDAGHGKKTALITRTAAWIFCPLLTLAILGSIGFAWMNGLKINRSIGDDYADEIVKKIGNRRFGLGMEWIDPHVQLRLQQKGINDFTFFSPYRLNNSAYINSLKKVIEESPRLGKIDRHRLEFSLKESFMIFVQDFYLSQDTVCETSVAFNLSELWYAARKVPIPEGVIFGGAKNVEEAHKVDPLPESKILWKKWKPIVTGKKESFDPTAILHKRVAQSLSLIANNTGVFLADQGKINDAIFAYKTARDFYDENISALLNLYELVVRQNLLPSDAPALRKDFEAFKANHKRRGKYDLASVSRVYGYIRNFELFAQMGWQWAASGSPAAALAGLRAAQAHVDADSIGGGYISSMICFFDEAMGETEAAESGYQKAFEKDRQNTNALRGLTRMAIRRGDNQALGRWLQTGKQSGVVDASFDLDWVAYYMGKKDYDRARQYVEKYIASNPDSPNGWSVLGALELQCNNIDRVKTYVLEQLRRTARGSDLYFYYILNATILEQEGHPNSLREARAQFRRAVELRDNTVGLRSLIINIDMRLKDSVSAEADAMALLRQEPNHWLGNSVIGSLRLQNGYLELAQNYLEKAAASPEADYPTLINCAEVLARNNQHSAALAQFKRAEAIQPERFETFATAAFIHARAKNKPDAIAALLKARDLMPRPGEPRLAFVDAWLAFNEDDHQQVVEICEKLQAELGENITPIDILDMKTLGVTVEAPKTEKKQSETN